MDWPILSFDFTRGEDSFYRARKSYRNLLRLLFLPRYREVTYAKILRDVLSFMKQPTLIKKKLNFIKIKNLH